MGWIFCLFRGRHRFFPYGKRSKRCFTCGWIEY